METQPIKVLIVDDHAVVRNGVRLMLSLASDISVAGEAQTAPDALSLVLEQTFDVALVDIALPGKSGFDLLKSLRTLQPKLAVLILSAYSEEIYALRVLKLGAAGYLTKACSAITLIAAVRKAALGGKYVSPALAEQFAGLMSGTKTLSHDALSNRELEVLKLIAKGESLIRIGEILHLSPKTVTTYRARILEKMVLSSNAELTRYALENGLLP